MLGWQIIRRVVSGAAGLGPTDVVTGQLQHRRRRTVILGESITTMVVHGPEARQARCRGGSRTCGCGVEQSCVRLQMEGIGRRGPLEAKAATHALGCE